MRVMVIVKASKESEAGIMPSQELRAKMGKFNQELMQAGVFLGADGLHPSSKGKRVKGRNSPSLRGGGFRQVKVSKVLSRWGAETTE